MQLLVAVFDLLLARPTMAAITVLTMKTILIASDDYSFINTCASSGGVQLNLNRYLIAVPDVKLEVGVGECNEKH